MNEEKHEVRAPNFEGEPMKMPENTDAQALTVEKSSVVNGPLLFTLAIILVLILGGMYFWFNALEAEVVMDEPTPLRPTPEENNEPESTTAEAQTDIMLTTSTSDEISAIEADIGATNLDSLDAELEAIDAELEASLQ
ncbi:hypothetical protein H6785_02980 [Candidatus Nomurabacteria bacterium]|nr:hypothetical protein [Candidatus Nomurabacteria bacterium]